MTITRTVGVDFEVKPIDLELARKLIAAILIDDLTRENYGTTSIPAGRSVDVYVETADGATEVDVDVRTSAGEFSVIDPQYYVWMLPSTNGDTAILELRVFGTLDGGETSEPYVHVLRLE